MPENLDLDKKLILLLGGARAGKSAYALKLAAAHERDCGTGVCFIATAQGLDDDMTVRIGRHRTQRPPHWRTIEEPYRLDQALRQTGNAGFVIVDCLTLFVSNWLLRYEDEHRGELAARQITGDLLKLVRSRQQTVIFVSNETGLGIVPETRLGRVFRDLLGSINQEFSEAADEVYLLVAGLPLQLKPGVNR